MTRRILIVPALVDDCLGTVGVRLIERRRRIISGSVNLDQFLAELEEPDHGIRSIVGRHLMSRPASRAARTALSAWQRVARGWDDESVWSLDTHLARTLSEQLTHLADTTHTFPGTSEYPTPEEWEAALRDNAQKLRTYSDNVFTSMDADLLERQYLDAQQAMRWVADNFGHLWD